MINRTFALCAALSVIAVSSAQAQESVVPAASVPVATASPATAAPAAEAPRPARRVARDVIMSAELEGTAVADALDAVQKFHPQWLRARGSASFSRTEQVMVHINNIPSGGVAALRRVRAPDVVEIRRLDGTAATQRFGTGYGAGVIMVTTR